MGGGGGYEGLVVDGVVYIEGFKKEAGSGMAVSFSPSICCLLRSTALVFTCCVVSPNHYCLLPDLPPPPVGCFLGEGLGVFLARWRAAQLQTPKARKTDQL